MKPYVGDLLICTKQFLYEQIKIGAKVRVTRILCEEDEEGTCWIRVCPIENPQERYPVPFDAFIFCDCRTCKHGNLSLGNSFCASCENDENAPKYELAKGAINEAATDIINNTMQCDCLHRKL